MKLAKALLFRFIFASGDGDFSLWMYVYIQDNVNIHIRIQLGFDGNICDDRQLFIYLFLQTFLGCVSVSLASPK